MVTKWYVTQDKSGCLCLILIPQGSLPLQEGKYLVGIGMDHSYFTPDNAYQPEFAIWTVGAVLGS